MKNNLHNLFHPESIAVVGASNDPYKAGNTIVSNLLRKGYQGNIFPVNPKESHICGVKAYPTLESINEKIDIVVLIMPAKLIANVMNDLDIHYQKHKDIKFVICGAADFAETKTDEGIERQRILLDKSLELGIRVLGPNCIGIINGKNGVDTTIVQTGDSQENPEKSQKAGISFLSQSGSVASAILMLGDSNPDPMYFNKFVTFGNMADLDYVDFLEYLENDESTKVIGIYLEGYNDGRALLDAMSKVTLKKPIVILKVGRSKLGSQAASSHTGSMAGSDEIYTAAFKQHGVIRVDTIEELFDTLLAFDQLPIPKDDRVFLMTASGGPGIYCTDAIESAGNIQLTDINEVTLNDLTEALPPMAAINSPVGYADITAASLVEEHVNGIRILMNDNNVSTLIVIAVVPTFLKQPDFGEGMVDEYLRLNTNKPIYFSIMSGDYVKPSRQAIERKGIPTFENPKRLVAALSNVLKYKSFIDRKSEVNTA